MAEKEERILVLKATEDDFIYKHFNGKGFIPRQEAINRIAKNICANEDEYTDCKQCGFNEPEDCKRYYRNNWLYTAEAALNALLEGTK